jgi:hypothetical protein
VAPIAWVACAPPGVIRIVLAGGGAIATLLELLELELLLLALLEPGEPHGSIATVCVSVLFGITIRLDPGGTLLVPDCETTAASEHEVTAIVRGIVLLGNHHRPDPGALQSRADRVLARRA